MSDGLEFPVYAAGIFRDRFIICCHGLQRNSKSEWTCAQILKGTVHPKINYICSPLACSGLYSSLLFWWVQGFRDTGCVVWNIMNHYRAETTQSIRIPEKRHRCWDYHCKFAALISTSVFYSSLTEEGRHLHGKSHQKHVFFNMRWTVPLI